MKVEELQRIRRWHAAHRLERPVEYHAWEAMLTLWVMGWVAWVPAYVAGALWGLPVCVAAMFAPTLYVMWRLRAHRQGLVRCDWLRG